MKKKLPTQGGPRPGAGRPARPMQPGERRRGVFYYATDDQQRQINILDVDERKQALLAKARLARLKRATKRKEV